MTSTGSDSEMKNNQLDEFEDDLNMSAAADELERTAGGSSKKRKASDDSCTPAKKNKEDNQLIVLKEQLKEIDPNNMLEIHNYIQDFDSDPIIKEYIEILLLVKSVQSAPCPEEIVALESASVKCKLPKNLEASLAHVLVCYFHSRYFNKNTCDATLHDKLFVPVSAPVFIPCFKDMPKSLLEKSTQAKKSLAKHLQSFAYDGSEFICELMKLRASKIIYDEVVRTNPEMSPGALQTEVRVHFVTQFLKCKMEFMKTYPIKSVNWEKYEDKVVHHEPNWRKGANTVPETRSFYAAELEKRILEGKEVSNPTSVKKEYDFFCENGAKFMNCAKSKILRKNSQKAGEYRPGSFGNSQNTSDFVKPQTQTRQAHPPQHFQPRFPQQQHMQFPYANPAQQHLFPYFQHHQSRGLPPRSLQSRFSKRTFENARAAYERNQHDSSNHRPYRRFHNRGRQRHGNIQHIDSTHQSNTATQGSSTDPNDTPSTSRQTINQTLFNSTINRLE